MLNEHTSFNVPLSEISSRLVSKLPEDVAIEYIDTGDIEISTTPLIREVLMELVPEEFAGAVISGWSIPDKNGYVEVLLQPASMVM